MSHESQRKPKQRLAVTDSLSKWRKQANFKHVNNELSVLDFVRQQKRQFLLTLSSFPPAPSCELLCFQKRAEVALALASCCCSLELSRALHPLQRRHAGVLSSCWCREQSGSAALPSLGGHGAPPRASWLGISQGA